MFDMLDECAYAEDEEQFEMDVVDAAVGLGQLEQDQVEGFLQALLSIEVDL